MSCPNLDVPKSPMMLEYQHTSKSMCKAFDTEATCNAMDRTFPTISHTLNDPAYFQLSAKRWKACTWNKDKDECEINKDQATDLCDAFGHYNSESSNECITADPIQAKKYCPNGPCCWEECATHVGFVDDNNKSCFQSFNPEMDGASTLNTDPTCMRRADKWYKRCVISNLGGMCNKNCLQKCNDSMTWENPLADPKCITGYCTYTCNKITANTHYATIRGT